MTTERIRYMGNTFFFNPDDHEHYFFDKADMSHVIIYIARDYAGVEHRAEWRIPGTKDKDVNYARRMSLKLPPWYISLIGVYSFIGENVVEKRAV